MFEIIYAKSVLKDLKRIDRKNLRRIKEKIEEFEDFPNIFTD